MCDEDIGREGRDKVAEKYPDNDRHSIDTRESMEYRRREGLSRDDTSHRITCEKEKYRYPDTEEK